MTSLAVASCAAPPLTGVGRATDLATTTAPKPTAEVLVVPSPIAPDFASHMARLGPDSFVATGHAGGLYAGTVYISPDARDVAVAARSVPVGTQLVMTTVERTTHRPGPTFFMEKKGEPVVWRFGIVESPGAKPEDVALCARCHAEAPHDDIFALP
jgi:hypothetical protein